MDLNINKIRKDFLKELPGWAAVDVYAVQAELLSREIDQTLEDLHSKRDIVDKIPLNNLTGNRIVKQPKRDIDLVKYYKKEAGETIILGGDEQKNDSELSKKLDIPFPKVAPDSTTQESIELLSRKPRRGELVFSMFKEKEPWVKCEIKSVYHKAVDGNGRAKTFFKLKILDSNVTIEVNKYCVARIQHHGDKLRVPKRVIAGYTEKELKPGIIGQEPCDINRYRYMVLMDDGSAHYFRSNQVYPIICQSIYAWRDPTFLGIRDRQLETELNHFFKTYPTRELLQIKPGVRFEMQRHGIIVPVTVLGIDCDTMKVAYADGSEETIYRGSTRFLRRANSISMMLRTHVSIDKLYHKLVGNMKRYYDAGSDAIGDTYLKFFEDFDRKLKVCGGVTARKSTAKPESPKIKVRFDCERVEDDRQTLPNLQILGYDNRSHKCTSACLSVPGARTEDSVRDLIDEFRNESDLRVPLLLGWKRRLVSTATRGARPRIVYIYEAPCGKIFQRIFDIRRYIQMTNSRLDIDYFSFDRDVELNQPPLDVNAYYAENNIAVDKRTGKPLENKFISLLNQFNHERLPVDFEYCSETFPHPMLRDKGFSFNHDFKSGCNCDDDCYSRSTCACHQLNEEASGSYAHNRGIINKNCQYQEKRLPAQVTTGIFECNSFCKCSSKCSNRVVQNGIRFRLQVRKTLEKGWGVVTLDDIPAGAFICTYAAELLDDADQYGNSDMYYADLDYISVVEERKLSLSEDERSDEGVDVDDEEEMPNNSKSFRKKNISDVCETYSDYDDLLPRIENNPKSRYPKRKREQTRAAPKQNNGDKRVNFKKIHSILNESHDYTLDARMQGNVGRFFNHSCDPNAYVQNIFIETHDLRFPVVAFFSKRSIRASQEITWNYNYKMGSIEGREIKCNCKAPNCIGRIL